MARIVYSAIVESIRGSIGGTTFQKNAYGYTVKKKPFVVKPSSNLQNRSKLIVSEVSRSWADLTSAQRTEYNTWAAANPQYAKHNPSSQLSGYAVFLKYNCLRILANEGIKTGNFLSVPAVDTPTFALANVAGTFYISINGSDESEDWIILFFLSRPFKSTENFIGTKTRYIKDLTNVDQDSNSTTAYNDIYDQTPAANDLIAMDALFIASDSPKVLARDSQIYTVGNSI